MELSICRELVRQNRGQISVSGNSKETIFLITFFWMGFVLYWARQNSFQDAGCAYPAFGYLSGSVFDNEKKRFISDYFHFMELQG